jgi:hypothetical protein
MLASVSRAIAMLACGHDIHCSIRSAVTPCPQVLRRTSECPYLPLRQPVALRKLLRIKKPDWETTVETGALLTIKCTGSITLKCCCHGYLEIGMRSRPPRKGTFRHPAASDRQGKTPASVRTGSRPLYPRYCQEV